MPSLNVNANKTDKMQLTSVKSEQRIFTEHFILFTWNCTLVHFIAFRPLLRLFDITNFIIYIYSYVEIVKYDKRPITIISRVKIVRISNEQDAMT